MNVRKFQAANSRDALRKVKESLGADAIILSNRSMHGGVEIMAVASKDMAMIVPNPSRDEQARKSARSLEPAMSDDDYTVTLTAARAKPAPAPLAARSDVPPRPAMPRPTNVATERPLDRAQERVAEQVGEKSLTRRNVEMERTNLPRTHESAAEMPSLAMMEELRSLRRMVEQHMAGVSWNETQRAEPVKADMLRQMLDAGFSPLFSRELLAALPPELDAAQALAWVKGAADRSLLTISSDHDIIDRGGVYALVGPTGVGKTTTTAKLAARCVVRHGADKVALVTTDGYRIGAHEQLRIYGRILGISVHLVRDAEELRQTLDELSRKHIVLIDTMGMSQRDKSVAEQIAMLVGSGGNVQRLLCLSATSRGDTLDDVIAAYRGSDLAGCVLTKVDEAASLATPLDAIMRHSLKLHYVSNGQRVPEDLHLPNRAYLLHRAFKDVPEVSPHRFDQLETGLVMMNAGVRGRG